MVISVYHWAAIAAGYKNRRIYSWYTGWLNAFAWTFGAASVSAVLANQVLAISQLLHPAYTIERWHLFLVYLAFTWISCSTVLFAHRALPAFGDMGAALVIVGVTVIVLVCAVMPSRNGAGYASNDFVWKDWVNSIGYSSDGFVFCAGMLNGAYAVGTPDCVTHLAEEIPQPSKNIPKAIGLQMTIGFITGLAFLVTLFYSVNDADSLLGSASLFPIAEAFSQATGSRRGAVGLLVTMLVPTMCTNVGCYITCGRIVWTLARDNATPFGDTLARVHPIFRNPFNATLCCGVVSTLMGFIFLGSSTAFNAFVGSFVVLTTLSYLGALLPYLLTNRKHVPPGWFRMPSWAFVPLATVSCLYMITFDVIFLFPYSLPVSAVSMNYTVVIVVGLVLLVTVIGVWKGQDFQGPNPMVLRKIQGIEIEETIMSERDDSAEKDKKRTTRS